MTIRSAVCSRASQDRHCKNPWIALCFSGSVNPTWWSVPSKLYAPSARRFGHGMSGALWAQPDGAKVDFSATARALAGHAWNSLARQKCKDELGEGIRCGQVHPVADRQGD